MNTIHSLFEQLTREIEAALARIDELNNRQKTLDEYDRRLQERKAELDRLTDNHRREQQDIESQKAYVTKQLEDVSRREIVDSILEKKREEVRRREEAVAIAEEKNTIKAAELEKLTAREAELDARESLLKKAASANLIRQDALTNAEEAVRVEAKRLQALAESWDKQRRG